MVEIDDLGGAREVLPTMAKQQAATETTDTQATDSMVFLKSTRGKPFGVAELAEGLELEGKGLAKAADKLLSSGQLRSLGKGHSIDEDGKVIPGPTRFKANLPPEGGEFWILPKNVPGVVIPGVGRFDINGRLIELTGEQRQFLESRACPVEVIIDEKKITPGLPRQYLVGVGHDARGRRRHHLQFRIAPPADREWRSPALAATRRPSDFDTSVAVHGAGAWRTGWLGRPPGPGKREKRGGRGR